MNGLSDKRVLLVGAGGLGSPVATLLARAGVGNIEVIDDDVVELSNLQRQTLYSRADVGGSKPQLAAARMRDEAQKAGSFRCNAVAREMRLTPATALACVKGFDLVVEGADNFPTKFLTADACALAGVACVQAGAVRWSGWTLGSVPGVSACLRCVFEDIPSGPDRGCSTAGVIGPVVGAIGALQASIALRLLSGDQSAAGVLHHYQALEGKLRQLHVTRAAACPLCTGQLLDLDARRYSPQECAA